MEKKTMEELIREANRAVQEDKKMTEEEQIEYDAEYGYNDEDDD